jgi:hypothetical protein
MLLLLDTSLPLEIVHPPMFPSDELIIPLNQALDAVKFPASDT